MTKDEFNKFRVERDADEIRKIACGYEGPDSACFGFIGLDSGIRSYFAAGRSDLMGACIAEGIAKVILAAGLDESFIDAIAITVRQFLQANNENNVQ